jgi:hypothetical protein
MKREETNLANVRIRPNQETPNQISQASSKYCDRINYKFEHKHIFSDDRNWLVNSWIDFNKVIFGKCNFPTL